MTIAGGNEFIWVYESGLNVQYLFAYGTLVSGANPLFQINVPMMMTLTKNGTTYRIYKNGVFAAEYVGNAFDAKTIQFWVLDQEQDGVGTGFDPNQNTNANWHNLKLYGRVLTDNEISQNFNAIRGRFGI
jgi:hypothetical protein